MESMKQSTEFEDPIRLIGPDATAAFDSTASNPTEHASSEALNAATTVDDDDEDEDEDEDDADDDLDENDVVLDPDADDEDDEDEYDDEDDEEDDEDEEEPLQV